MKQYNSKHDDSGDPESLILHLEVLWLIFQFCYFIDCCGFVLQFAAKNSALVSRVSKC